MARKDRDAFGMGTMVFAGFAMLFAFAALVVAGQAWTRSNDAKDAAANGGLASRGRVTLQEFQIRPVPTLYKAGAVTLTIHNVGSMTHELVMLKAPDAAALPKVQTPGGERMVGDVDEEAIPAADKMGESGDVKPGQTVVKTFHLAAGSYVMICNIDDKLSDGTLVSHFQRGMSATISAA